MELDVAEPSRQEDAAGPSAAAPETAEMAAHYKRLDSAFGGGRRRNSADVGLFRESPQGLGGASPLMNMRPMRIMEWRQDSPGRVHVQHEQGRVRQWHNVEQSNGSFQEWSTQPPTFPDPSARRSMQFTAPAMPLPPVPPRPPAPPQQVADRGAEGPLREEDSTGEPDGSGHGYSFAKTVAEAAQSGGPALANAAREWAHAARESSLSLAQAAREAAAGLNPARAVLHQWTEQPAVPAGLGSGSGIGPAGTESGRAARHSWSSTSSETTDSEEEDNRRTRQQRRRRHVHAAQDPLAALVSSLAQGFAMGKALTSSMRESQSFKQPHSREPYEATVGMANASTNDSQSEWQGLPLALAPDSSQDRPKGLQKSPFDYGGPPLTIRSDCSSCFQGAADRPQREQQHCAGLGQDNGCCSAAA